MTDTLELLVNSAAVSHSSRGVQRYFDRVMRHLDWDGPVVFFQGGRSSSWDRVRELLHPGRRNTIFWSPCQRGTACAKRHVVTVHDCISVEYTYSNDWRLPYYRRLSHAVLNNAAAVVAISEATKAAILRNYSIDANRITVIRSGDDVVARDSVPTVRADQPKEPFGLMVINALPHKNGLAACKAFAASCAKKSGVSLRIAGSLPTAALDILQGTGVRFELHSWVDEEALALWYASCRFLLSPSLDEGQNLVVAEALAYGAPVVCSDIPTHREFYDGRVRFFDPYNHDSMVAAIDRAIEESTPSVTAMPVSSRSFADVARDYRSLFVTVA